MHVQNELKNTATLSSGCDPSDRTLGAVRQSSFSDTAQFCLTALGLILVAPLFLVIGIIIKLTSLGPIFYRGLRVGQGRRVFKIYKFRTLQVGSEEKIGARLLRDQDSFYTTIGKFLKRTKLDELPQLINVLKGEMNLVGPRPIRPIFLENLSNQIPLYNMRFLVKPGMTGLAQVKGGYFTDPKDKLRYELVYIKNRSLLLDLKLIFLTFFKLLNRWFTLGFLCLTLFLFISFLQESIFPSVPTYLFGTRLNFIHLLIILGSGWLLAKRIPKRNFFLYRTPLNLPIALFFLYTLSTSYFSLHPLIALRGSLYYMVTGFVLVFIIANGDVAQRFVTNATKTVAIMAVFVSLVGLFELFLLYHSSILQVEAGLFQPQLSLPRISSTLGTPVILSAYLVLGFPLLLCELAYSKTKESRDFWLISSTIVFISIVLTQTRVGLLSLGITVAAFLFRKSKRHFVIFTGSFILLFLVLLSYGGHRYSPNRFFLEWRGAIASSYSYLSEISIRRLLTGIGTRNGKTLPTDLALSNNTNDNNQRPLPANMHLVLLIENGIIGWGLMLWILVAALRNLYWAYPKVKDPKLQMILWSIFSSIIGFLVSINSFEGFFTLSVQVLFWGIVGIGTAIVIQFSGRSPGLIKLWKFGD